MGDNKSKPMMMVDTINLEKDIIK